MRTIAIILGDNDFGNTFRPLLEGLKLVLEYHEHQLNQESVKLVIQSSVMSYYVGYQHHFDCSYPGYPEHLTKYLGAIKILFDEEAEADIATKDHDGGAWYLEIQSGVVRGY